MGSTKDRTWRIHPDPETGLVDEQEVHGAFLECATIMLRLGGGITVVPERFKHPQTGEWLTRSVAVQWTSFVPPAEVPPEWRAEAAEWPVQEEQLPGIDEQAFATLEGEEPEMRDADDAEADEQLEAEAEEEAVVLE